LGPSAADFEAVGSNDQRGIQEVGMRYCGIISIKWFVVCKRSSELREVSGVQLVW
jgi:hypothetical protein